MGVESFLIASSVNGILAQRLVRLICPHCKEAYDPDPVELERIGLTRVSLGDKKVYRGAGCEECYHTGYLGRSGIHEFLVVDEAIKGMILKTSDSSELKQYAKQQGMKTLVEDGADKVLQGVTTIEEVYRVAQG